MISRSLTRRLEELEARTAPEAERVIFEITFVSPDGRETEGPRFEVPRRRIGPTWPWKSPTIATDMRC